MTFRRSGGPSPRSAIIDSSTSSALPQALPSGRSIAVMSATTGQPWSAPSSIIVRARASPRSSSGRKAPEPRFTSSTSPVRPSASFFDIMLAEMSGILSTVAVASRRAYNRRSAGAISRVCPINAHPMRSSCAVVCASERSVRKPGIDSSLSRVPPVCPSPRPDIMGTATPRHATSGASTSDTLSPTPPVECLSMRAIVRWSRSSTAPLCSMASVRAPISSRSSPLK